MCVQPVYCEVAAFILIDCLFIFFTCLIWCWGDVKQLIIQYLEPRGHVIRHVCSSRGNCIGSEQYQLPCFPSAPSAMLVVKRYSDTFPQEQLATSVCSFWKTNKRIGGLVLKGMSGDGKTSTEGRDSLFLFAKCSLASCLHVRSPGPSIQHTGSIPTPSNHRDLSTGIHLARLWNSCPISKRWDWKIETELCSSPSPWGAPRVLQKSHLTLGAW